MRAEYLDGAGRKHLSWFAHDYSGAAIDAPLEHR